MEFKAFEENDLKSNRRCLYISKFKGGKSIYTQHGPQYFSFLVDIIRKHNPEMIVELGTHCGGATLVFHEEFLDIEIHTFDSVALIDLELFDRKKVFFYHGDLLSGENSVLVELLKKNKDKKKILYCDNGNKEKEIEWYSKYLSVGDIVGCHDWKVNVRPENVLPILEEYNFVSIPENNILEENGILSRFWVKL